MATNYFADGSSDNTDFDENEGRAAITGATRRRYESVHEMDQEGGRSNFTGFLNDDRPSQGMKKYGSTGACSQADLLAAGNFIIFGLSRAS